MHAQSVTHIRRNLGLGNLGAGAGRSTQVSAADAITTGRRRRNCHRRLHRRCDRGEIGDGSAVAIASHLQLLLLLLLLRVFQRSEESRTPSVMQSSVWICIDCDKFVSRSTLM